MEEYLPDPMEPVNRWFTMPNTGNVKTVARTINDLCGNPPSAVVDPYSGAGSTAVATRRLGLPFHGIELDPVLACVTTAKALCGPAELDQPCLRVIHDIQHEPGGGGLDESAIAADLAVIPSPVQGSVVRCGSSDDPEIWRSLRLPPENVALFSSPPFFRDWIRPMVSQSVVDTARALMGAVSDASSLRDYGDFVIAALRGVIGAGAHGTAIFEHEPGDSVDDRLPDVLTRVPRETDATVTSVLTTKRFSEGGLLSLLVCEF